MLPLEVRYFLDTILLLVEKGHLLALQLIPNLGLLIQFFFELIFSILLLNLNVLNPLDALPFDPVHFIFVPPNEILDIHLFLLELFGLDLQLFEVLFDVIGLLSLLLNHFVAA